MRPLPPTLMTLLKSCVLAGALAVCGALGAPASAESGAHRNPPPPPVHVDVAPADLR